MDGFFEGLCDVIPMYSGCFWDEVGREAKGCDQCFGMVVEIINRTSSVEELVAGEEGDTDVDCLAYEGTIVGGSRHRELVGVVVKAGV